MILAFGAYAWAQKQTAQQALQQAREQKKAADEQKELATTQKGIATRKAEEARQQKERAEQQSLLAEEEKQNAQRQEQNAEQQSKLAQEQSGIAETEREKAEAQKLTAVAAQSAEQKQREKAEQQQQQAETARGQAQASERQALKLRRLSLARALSLQIVRPQQGGEDRELPALLALEAYRLNRENGGVAEDPDLFNALRVSLGPLPVLRGHQDGVRAVALVPDGPPDGQTAFSGGEDGKLLRFDLRHPAAPPALLASFPGPVRAVAVRLAGDLLAAGGTSGPIRIWNLRQPGAPPRDLPATGAVSSLAFQPGGALLAAGSPDGVKLWDAGHPAGQPDTAPLSLGEGKRVTAVAFSPDGKTLAAGLAKGGALLWEVGRPSAKPRSACGALDVRSLAFSPDGTTLACGAGRGEIVLTMIGQTGRAGAAPVSLPGHASSVNSLRFNAQGDFLASATPTAPCGCGTCSTPARHRSCSPATRDGSGRWRSPRTAGAWFPADRTAPCGSGRRGPRPSPAPSAPAPTAS